MTISSTTRKAGPFVGNGVTTEFPFDFKLFATSDLRVVRADALGVETDLVHGVDAAIALNADQDENPGGSVTLAEPLAVGCRLVLLSAVPELQPVDLTNQGGFYPELLNGGLDRNTVLVQQLREEVGRSITLPVTADPGDLALPAPTPGQLLAWSDDGLTNLDPSSLISVVAYGATRVDKFDGDGATTAFSLSATPGVQNNLRVSIGGVMQTPGEDFTWAGGVSLSFTVAPPAGTRIVAQYQEALIEFGAANADLSNVDPVTGRRALGAAKILTSEAVSAAEVADTAYAAGAFAQLKPGEVSNLAMVAANFTDQCTWLGSQSAGQSDAMNLAVPDGYHLINGNCSVTGAGQKVNLVGSAIPDFITATAVAISTVSANLYEATITVATALPARVVVNYALGMQNFKGDNGAESVNGCHQVTSIAPDRLSFKFQYRAFGIVPTSPTTLDMATTMGLLACQVVVYKACLRVSYLGWTGGAQIGFLNARKGASISGKWCSISYDGPAGDHCIAYAEGAGAAVYFTDYFGIAGAGDKVTRSGTGGHIYTNRACLGGGVTAAEIWQGFGGTASFARTMMGSVATSILTPTADSSYVAVSCVAVGAAYGTRTTYEDSSGSWGTSTIAFCSWGLGVTRGQVNIDAASMVKKCTFPILPSIGGVVAGDFVASENTNAAVASNTILANGGVWSRISALNVQTLPRIQAALDFPSIAAGAYQDLTIAYPGAALGDYVIGGRTTTLPGQAVFYTYFVSLADVVTVRAMNFSAAAIDPVSATHRVSVVKSA